MAFETKDGLYEAQVSVSLTLPIPFAFISNSIDWHRRLGHASEERIKGTASCVVGLLIRTSKKAPTYQHCNIVKSVRSTKSSKSNIDISQAPLQKFYTGVVGPFGSPSLGGAKYFLTLIEEYSGYSFVSFLNSKEKNK